MRVSSRARRRTVLFGALLLAALVVFIGCPADGGGGNGNGGNGNPPPGNGNPPPDNGNPPPGNENPPPAPTNLMLTAEPGQIVLSWEVVDGADEYYIFRATAGGTAMRIADDTTIDRPTYTDTDVTNGTQYSYMVRAVNANGESGDSAPQNAAPPLTPITALQVGSGQLHTCARLDDNSVKCWGLGGSGALGLGNTNNIGAGGSTLTVAAAATINFGSNRTATQISTGNQHACAILDDNSTKCWGNGNLGQLGSNDSLSIGDGQPADVSVVGAAPLDFGSNRTARKISAGLGHTCAILSDDSVKCWGSGADGRLGLGNATSVGEPTSSSPTVAAAAEVNFGSGVTAKEISAGHTHTCAILNDNSVKCWGSGADGRLGQGNELNIGDGGTTGTTAHLTVAGAAAINFGGNRTAKEISAGGSHTCAILSDDSVKCWGDGGSGRLGQGNELNIGDVATPAARTVAGVTSILLGSGATAKQISTGFEHTCALLNDNSVKCWGEGANSTSAVVGRGRLGQGSVSDIGNSSTSTVAGIAPIVLGTGRTARAISTGGFHTCALLDNNGVKCWGEGGGGSWVWGMLTISAIAQLAPSLACRQLISAVGRAQGARALLARTLRPLGRS